MPANFERKQQFEEISAGKGESFKETRRDI